MNTERMLRVIGRHTRGHFLDDDGGSKVQPRAKTLIKCKVISRDKNQRKTIMLTNFEKRFGKRYSTSPAYLIYNNLSAQKTK